MREQDFTILVVEDDPNLLEIIAFELQRQGYRVLTALNGKLALEMVDDRHIDLILSDIRMPQGDGITLLQEVRKKNPTCPIIFLMTGYAEITESECIQKGAQKVIRKPFDRKKLVQSIHDALAIL